MDKNELVQKETHRAHCADMAAAMKTVMEQGHELSKEARNLFFIEEHGRRHFS